METRIVKARECNKQTKTAICQCIRQGGLVAFPTETVYGLGGNGLNAAAAKKIYQAKGRPSDNPLILHISDRTMLHQLVTDITPIAEKLITAFWPGPLTIILPKSKIVPLETTGGLETVAIRMPDNQFTREIIQLAQTPLAGPSANISGRPSPTTAQMVYEDLHGKIDYILDDGDTIIGLESTIVDCTGTDPIILRPGSITYEMLREITPTIQLDESLVQNPRAAEIISTAPKAPGMKYRHYAPLAPMILYEGNVTTVLKTILGLLDNLHNKLPCRESELCKNYPPKIGLIISDELAAALKSHSNSPGYDLIDPDLIYSYGSLTDYSTIGANIYKALRFFDSTTADFIVTQGVDNYGLGVAIMNRLRKAATFTSMFL